MQGAISGKGEKTRPSFNLLVTNLMGPASHLFMCGARLERFQVQMMQSTGISPVIAVISYAGDCISR